MRVARLRSASALTLLFADLALSLSLRPFVESLAQSAKLLEKRNTTVVPAPLNIEASQFWDGNDGPWSSFELQLGNAPQDVRVFISTAGCTTFTVQALGCPAGTIVGCENSRGDFFLTNESNTWVANSIYNLGLEANLGLDSTADYGFDTITLGFQGSGGPSVEHSTVASLADYAWWIGIFGLKPQSSNFTTLNSPQPSFMNQLKTNHTIPSLSWAYTAGNQYRFDGDKNLGSLVLGGYDQSKITPTNLTIPFAADVSRDLVVGVQSITSNATSTAFASNGDAFYAYVDSTVAQMYLPVAVCEAFETAFDLTWNDTTELYLVNSTQHDALLAQNAFVTLTLGQLTTGGETVDITLPYSAFDLEVSYPLVDTTQSYFPLKRAYNDSQYALGRTFFQEAYVIADYERGNFTVAPCAWTLDAKADIRTILSPGTTITQSGSSGISGGAIAGVVVGIVAVIAIIGLVIWFLRRKKQTKKRQIAELEANERVAKEKEQQEAECRPFIGGGEELDGADVHEMQAPFKRDAYEMPTPPLRDSIKAGYFEMDGGSGDYMGSRYGAREMQVDLPVHELEG